MIAKRCKLCRILERVLKEFFEPPKINFKFDLPQDKAKLNTMITKTLTNVQKQRVILNITSQSGHAARLDGAPTWEVEEGDATIEPAEDGLSCFLISEDRAGTSRIRVHADADLGPGIETIEEVIELVTVEERATSLGLQFDDPVDKGNPIP